MIGKIVREMTATIRARTPYGREVTIQEVTERLCIAMPDGRMSFSGPTRRVYSISPSEPVDWNEVTGYSLARTGEPLTPLD